MSSSRPVLRIRSAVIGEAERVLVLSDRAVTLGRAEDNDVMLLEQATSRHHARIEPVGEGYRVIDLGSTTGVWIDAQRVNRRELADGDVLKIGDSTVQYVASPHRQPTLARRGVATEVDGGPKGARSPSAPVDALAATPDDRSRESDGTPFAPPSSQSTERGTPVPPPRRRRGGTQVAPHVPARPPAPIAARAFTEPEPVLLPSGQTAEPAARPPVTGAAPPEVSVSAAPPPTESRTSQYVLGPGYSGVAPRQPPSIVPSAGPGPGRQHRIEPQGPMSFGTPSDVVVRSSPSDYELGDAARVGAGNSQIDLLSTAPAPHQRPVSTLASSRSSVGSYIIMFVVGLAIALTAATLVYGL